MNKYIGITIGPIGDTLNEASTPAALWFASRMFSEITRRLCEKIKEEFGTAARIFSPYYVKEGDENISGELTPINMKDGIGKFHDRIIFYLKEEWLDEGNTVENTMKKIVSTVKKSICDTFPLPEEELGRTSIESFMERYLQIHYVIMDEDTMVGKENEKKRLKDTNCILALSPYLDTLELMKTFPLNDVQNPIRRLFQGDKFGRNNYIKRSNLFHDILPEYRDQFKNKNGAIRSIEDIASGKKEKTLKKENYFAVVQADGDKMGSYLSGLGNNNEAITAFSEKCLKYTEEAGKMVGEFGGMTIYAGGDDLLFLAPVENEGGKTVFKLCNEIQTCFKEKVGEDGPKISFGISIQYVKYPLYEAKKNAEKLLFQKAKKLVSPKVKENEEKNCMAIEVQKHSGQTFGLMVSNKDYRVFEKIIKGKNAITDEALHSLLYKLELYRPMILLMNEKAATGEKSKEDYLEVWKQLFDNEGQKPYQDYLEEIATVYYENFIGKNKALIFSLEEEKEGEDTSLEVLIWLLRLKKFMIEKEGEKE